MKAALLLAPRDVRVEKVPDPTLGAPAFPAWQSPAGEALVRVRAAGICGSDLHRYRGHRDLGPQASPILGHEVAGEVVSVSAGVTKVKPGDRIAVEPLIGCGACAMCMSGAYNICPDLKFIGAQYPGGFAELVKAPELNLFVLPDSVSYEDATLVDGFAVAVHALRRVPVQPWEDVLILGGGAIGLEMLQMVRLAGARRVIISVTHPVQGETARGLGADVVLNAREVDVAAAVRDLTGGRGVDVAFETVGGEGKTLAQAIPAIARQGRLCVIGGFDHPQLVDFNTTLRREIDVRFAFSYGRWQGQSEFGHALDLLASGRLSARPLITHRYPLAEAGEAFRAADDKASYASIKVLVLQSNDPSG